MSRILNSVSKDENPKIRQCKDEKKQGILVIKESDGREYFIDGNIAETSELELFLEDAEKNPHIARSLASLAMYLSAKAQLNGGIRK
jgi:CRISPR type I-A-associated protein Csa5